MNIGTVLVIAAVAVNLVIYTGGLRQATAAWMKRQADSIMLTQTWLGMLLLNFQVLVGLAAVSRQAGASDYPEPMRSCVRSLEWLAGDIFEVFDLRCNEAAVGANFETALRVATLVPIALTVLGLIASSLEVACYGGKLFESSILKTTFQIINFILPNTATVVTSAFAVTFFENGDGTRDGFMTGTRGKRTHNIHHPRTPTPPTTNRLPRNQLQPT